MPDFAAGAAQIAGMVRHGRAQVIPGAGHLAPLEAPDAFRSLVLEFLDGQGPGDGRQVGSG